MKYGTIYVIKNIVNNKYYVGQTMRSAIIRFNEHLKNSDNINNKGKFINAIRKYGKNMFILYFVVNNIPQKELDFLEKGMIKKLDSVDNGYNSDSGGNKNKIISKESRKKMSIKKIGTAFHKGFLNNNATKEKMRLAKLGRPGPWAGKKRKDLEGGNHFNARKIICLETKEIFSCAMDIERKYGYGHSNIAACCNGRYKYSHGFHWAYYEDAK